MFIPRSLLLANYPDPRADDVDLAFLHDECWVAWSTAELEEESILFSRWENKEFGKIFSLLDEKIHNFRPSITAVNGGILVLGSAKKNGKYSPVGAFYSKEKILSRFSLSAKGNVFQLSLASHPEEERAWVAWEERNGSNCILQIGQLDTRGEFFSYDLKCNSENWQRSPTLLLSKEGPWLAWVEGKPGEIAGRIYLSRLGKHPIEAQVLDSHPAPQEAPILALTPENRPLVAWHAAKIYGETTEIIRWLQVAEFFPDDLRVSFLSPTPEQVKDQASSGVDQAWEFPGLAVTKEGQIWLAGRSSHGYHLSLRTRETPWSKRLSVSEDFWGGRGRKLALRTHPTHGVLFARREPAGVTLSLIEAQSVKSLKEETETTDSPIKTSWGIIPGPVANFSKKVLFGDLHQHTVHSDGVGSLEELYCLARDIRQLDFAAITDHDHFCRRALGPATWGYMCSVSEAFYDPGRFVSFAAYEFTGLRFPGPGHKCIYFGDRYPEKVPTKEVEKIFAILEEYDGIAVPHHIGWTGADMEHHDPKIQPVWEICSVHGCYHCFGAPSAFPTRGDPDLPGQFVEDALRKNLRFGFIGSTDSHGLLWHHGISPKRNPFRAGIAGIIGADLNRASILEAIRQRRTYATTGARILLHVNFEGALMGSELPANTNGSLEVLVEGTAPLTRVSLVRPQGETPLEGIFQNRLETSVTIKSNAKYTWEYFYIHVVQEDGEMAWSSPIWIG